MNLFRRALPHYLATMLGTSHRAVTVAAGGLIALAAAIGIGRFVYTPILPFMGDALGLTKAEAGIIASANFLGYLLGALAASTAGLPGGRRGWLLGSLTISALTTGAMGLTASIPLFLMLRFLAGVASAFVMVFGSALVLDRVAAAGRSGLSAVHFAGVGVGIAASAVLVAALAALAYDWRVQWVASGALSLAALAVVWFSVPGGPDPARSPTAPGRSRGNGRLARLIVAYGLFGFGYVITATFISTMMRGSAELRPLEPVIWLVVGVAAIPSVALWAWIGRRWGNDRSFAVACAVEGVGVALSVLATGGVAIVLSAALLGGTFMGITALGLIHARDMTGGDPRRSLALMTAAFGIGQIIGPAFAGFAHEVGDSFLPPSLVAASGLMVAGGLVVGWRAAPRGG